MSTGITQDWPANRGNPKALIILTLFRVAQKMRRAPRPVMLLCVPLLMGYRVLVEWVLGVELPWNLTVGPRLRLYHGQALVIHDHCRIGSDCILRHSTTLGMGSATEGPSQVPTLGDFVDIGSNVCIIGGITIGNHVVIGAGSVVVKDVPDYAVVVGNPARILRINTPPA